MKNTDILSSTDRFPPIGARIVKSALGVTICMIIYFIRDLLPIGKGIPFYSAIAVLWCTQPYTDTVKSMAKQRTIGTLIGALYGLMFLLFFGLFENPNRAVIYFTASILIVPIIYSTVLINKRNASYFSCVVFLSIAITHSLDANPYLFVLNRILDTMIGVLVAMFINSIHPPIKDQGNTLYVSGIDSILAPRRGSISQYNKIELNRLIERGVNFTISTIRTPAALMETMQGINLQLPVVAMDGAVLYDINENRYLKVFSLEPHLCEKAERIIEEESMHCFVNALYDNTLHIYYGDFKNDAERDLFSKLHRSPYRNYTDKKYRIDDRKEKTVYLMMLLKNSDAKRIYDKLDAKIGNDARIVIYPAYEYEGYSRVKIYSKDANKANMLEILKEQIDVEKTVTFGSVAREYDVHVNDDGGNSAVKAIKRLCEGKKIDGYNKQIGKA